MLSVKVMFAALMGVVAAAGTCAPGQIQCGAALMAEQGYTKADLVAALAGKNVKPELALFECGQADELAYEGSYCLGKCVGGDDPNTICTCASATETSCP
ncbi:uncharacterized protein J7T54_001994 [Emericellopsis cladophorae]|uniref:Uncharacterized protein n=1 Tax=Emericellopsis cladophorae TaxID=2686198 RepID=A0A9P9XXV0_9HYPO|nr:uncharacterized protein J7T54_001994 [Emericellopsis cladophorae]KAI6779906.1 hypothetical protein J7T54_001994 [Emericellopsis cladophorae]